MVYLCYCWRHRCTPSFGPAAPLLNGWVSMPPSLPASVSLGSQRLKPTAVDLACQVKIARNTGATGWRVWASKAVLGDPDAVASSSAVIPRLPTHHKQFWCTLQALGSPLPLLCLASTASPHAMTVVCHIVVDVIIIRELSRKRIIT